MIARLLTRLCGNKTELPLPPGGGGLPWLGQFRSFIADPQGFVLSRKARWGDIFRARVYLRNTIFFSTPAANKWIFRGEGNYLRKNWPLAWKRLSGRHAQSVTSDPQQHARQMGIMRRILTPTDEMVAQFISIGRQHLHDWAGREAVEPALDIKLLALQIDSAALLGQKFNLAQCRELLEDFAKLSRGFSCLFPVDLPGFPFARAMAARRRLQQHLDRILTEQDALSPKLHPLAQLLAHAKEHGVSYEELRDQLQMLLFAGHEFPANAMISACLELGRNPDIQARLRSESRTIDAGSPRQALSARPYLDAFSKEVLRMYPPVPGGYRQLTRDVEYAGYHLPKGWSVKFDPFLCHFDPRYWQRPESFDPDRFTAPRHEQTHPPLAYIPFGGGHHACPGGRYGVLLMKTFVSELVKTYRLELFATRPRQTRYGHSCQPDFRMRLLRIQT